jgi:cytochrome c553
MNKLSILALALICATGAHAAGDAVRGKAKADQACAACHAVQGNWNKTLAPDQPKLAGQHYDYLVTALNAYKQGEKSVIGRKSAVMAPMAAALSRQDIEDIAAYLSAMPGELQIRR